LKKGGKSVGEFSYTLRQHLSELGRLLVTASLLVSVQALWVLLARRGVTLSKVGEFNGAQPG
jgi:hypothetical protein